MNDLSFTPMPQGLRPPAYAEAEFIRIDGRMVGTIARVSLDHGDVVQRPWSWFVVEACEFYAGRAVSLEAARMAAEASLLAILHRESAP